MGSDATGAALAAELERRFVIAAERVVLSGFALELLKPQNADDLISEEDFAQDERLPYWADLWPAGRVLASRLLEEDARGRRLLELGCGLGLVTIAAMRAGFEVLATDYYDDALRFTRVNAWRALGREPATRYVDWRYLPDDLGAFDVVAAADVLYERPYAELIASALTRVLVPHGEALVADPGRVAAGPFLERCRASGLRIAGTEMRPYTEGDIRQTIRVYRIIRPGRVIS